MTVRMTTGVAGTDPKGRVYAFGPGEERTVPKDEALRLLQEGSAEPVARKAHEVAEKRGPGRPRKQVR